LTDNLFPWWAGIGRAQRSSRTSAGHACAGMAHRKRSPLFQHQWTLIEEASADPRPRLSVAAIAPTSLPQVHRPCRRPIPWTGRGARHGGGGAVTPSLLFSTAVGGPAGLDNVPGLPAPILLRIAGVRRRFFPFFLPSRSSWVVSIACRASLESAIA